MTSIGKIHITENRLKHIIREAIKESLNGGGLLLESGSGRHFTREVRRISYHIIGHKKENDRHRYVNNIHMYPIRVSLKPFFGDKEGIAPEVIEDKTYWIKACFDSNKQTNWVEGACDITSLHSHDPSRPNIFLIVPRFAKYDDVVESLIHEVTHLVDGLIQEYVGYKSHYYFTPHMEHMGLPEEAKYILYALWTTSEFNAWSFNIETNKRQGYDYCDLLMGYLSRLYKNNDTDVWSKIKLYVALADCNDKLMNMDLYQFKKYFIDTSLKLLKKMVKKYY